MTPPLHIAKQPLAGWQLSSRLWGTLCDNVFLPRDLQPLGDMLTAKHQENSRGSSSGEYL
jgi:hypothetical protein